jgi:hypothetical protein
MSVHSDENRQASMTVMAMIITFVAGHKPRNNSTRTSAPQADKASDTNGPSRRLVMRGLDPRIHLQKTYLFQRDGSPGQARR